MTANRRIQITAVAVGAVWPVLAGPAAACASERRWHAAVSDRVELDLGYRRLEGGADNDEVYTFAFFNYAVAGVRVRL
jgi:hypothetical protein